MIKSMPDKSERINSNSFDSRNWGALKEEFIVGRTIIRAWPPKAMASFFGEVDY